MTTLEIITAGLALTGAAVGVTGLAAQVLAAQRRPLRADLAPAKGSAAIGVLYAFTEGMAPWSKESTRMHWVGYLRGIAFHGAIFAGLALLVASPWLGELPPLVRGAAAVILVMGTLAGLAGFGPRLSDPTLRRLSTPDDYLSLALVTAFLGAGTMASAAPAFVAAFWGISGVLLAYAPLGKIRHCVYFFYSRTFFGLLFGRRGVLERAR